MDKESSKYCDVYGSVFVNFLKAADNSIKLLKPTGKYLLDDKYKKKATV